MVFLKHRLFNFFKSRMGNEYAKSNGVAFSGLAYVRVQNPVGIGPPQESRYRGRVWGGGKSYHSHI